jgi:hypothetical protein
LRAARIARAAGTAGATASAADKLAAQPTNAQQPTAPVISPEQQRQLDAYWAWENEQRSKPQDESHYLFCGYRGDLGMHLRPYTRDEFVACCDFIEQSGPMSAVEFKWMSLPSFGHVSDYMFDVYSPAGWFEQVHKPLSVVRFYLPAECLQDGGAGKFETLRLDVSRILRPLHGAAGLGIQECHEWEGFSIYRV